MALQTSWVISHAVERPTPNSSLRQRNAFDVARRQIVMAIRFSTGITGPRKSSFSMSSRNSSTRWLNVGLDILKLSFHWALEKDAHAFSHQIPGLSTRRKTRWLDINPASITITAAPRLLHTRINVCRKLLRALHRRCLRDRVREEDLPPCRPAEAADGSLTKCHHDYQTTWLAEGIAEPTTHTNTRVGLFPPLYKIHGCK